MEGEAATRCISSICSAQVKERVKHFASKGAFDIDGLGDKLVDQLVDKGLVSSFADLFRVFHHLYLFGRVLDLGWFEVLFVVDAFILRQDGLFRGHSDSSGLVRICGVAFESCRSGY